MFKYLIILITAFSALEKELLKQLEESKNKIIQLEEQMSFYKEKNEVLLS